MSAGAFINSKYAADYGDGTAIHPIRIQPELLDVDFDPLSNIEPDGDINNPISAVSSLGRRQKGLKPRQVVLKVPVNGSAPTGYLANSVTVVTVLRPNVFAAIQVGSEAQYLGFTWVVVSKYPEITR